MLRGLLMVVLLGSASAQYYLFKGQCPPENSAVASFRNMTSVAKPIFIPLMDRLLKDSQYAEPAIQDRLAEVDLEWKVAMPLNNTTDMKLFAPFLDRCCDGPGHPCTKEDIVLQYVNFEGGVCWVVWPEAYFIYKKCTCCACQLVEDCPVIGRCVETDYHTVGIIAYCPHIIYSDRFQNIALRLPTNCRCQAHCPTPLSFVLPDNVGLAQARTIQKSEAHAGFVGKK